MMENLQKKKKNLFQEREKKGKMHDDFNFALKPIVFARNPY